MSQEDKSEDNKGFFYIIKTSDVEDGVYKIGKSKRDNPNKRLCEYPKRSSVQYTIAVNDADGFEDLVMRKFRVEFERKLELGLEYYKGNIEDMIDSVHNLWKKYNKADKIELDKRIEKIKPNGFQAWCNDWYSKQEDKKNIDMDVAYLSYVNMMQNDFASNEYATKEVFLIYLDHMLS